MLGRTFGQELRAVPFVALNRNIVSSHLSLALGEGCHSTTYSRSGINLSKITFAIFILRPDDDFFSRLLRRRTSRILLQNAVRYGSLWILRDVTLDIRLDRGNCNMILMSSMIHFTTSI